MPAHRYNGRRRQLVNWISPGDTQRGADLFRAHIALRLGPVRNDQRFDLLVLRSRLPPLILRRPLHVVDHHRLRLRLLRLQLQPKLVLHRLVQPRRRIRVVARRRHMDTTGKEL